MSFCITFLFDYSAETIHTGPQVCFGCKLTRYNLLFLHSFFHEFHKAEIFIETLEALRLKRSHAGIAMIAFFFKCPIFSLLLLLSNYCVVLLGMLYVLLQVIEKNNKTINFIAVESLFKNTVLLASPVYLSL